MGCLDWSYFQSGVSQLDPIRKVFHKASRRTSLEMKADATPSSHQLVAVIVVHRGLISRLSNWEVESQPNNLDIVFDHSRCPNRRAIFRPDVIEEQSSDE